MVRSQRRLRAAPGWPLGSLKELSLTSHWHIPTTKKISRATRASLKNIGICLLLYGLLRKMTKRGSFVQSEAASVKKGRPGGLPHRLPVAAGQASGPSGFIVCGA